MKKLKIPKKSQEEEGRYAQIWSPPLPSWVDRAINTAEVPRHAGEARACLPRPDRRAGAVDDWDDPEAEQRYGHRHRTPDRVSSCDLIAVAFESIFFVY